MKRFLTHLFALASIGFAVSANAALIDLKFNGNVSTQSNTVFGIGAPIAGEFIYDTIAARYLSFMIGGQSVASGYASSANLTPDLFSAIYQAQVSPLAGGNVNSTFVVDLEGINPWPSTNALGLLLMASTLATNLDTTLSTFGFYNANADGTNVRSLTASLSAIAVTAIPEPGSAALLLIGLTAFGLRARRKQR